MKRYLLVYTLFKMKALLLLLPFIILNRAHGQDIDFHLVVMDTAEHFNPLPYTNAHFDTDLIIASDSIFKRVFRSSRITVDRPKFKESILLKRSISGACLSKIENTVTIDSTEQTITWYTTVTSATCRSKDTRHIVVEIPTPPPGYRILFDTTFLKKELKLEAAVIDSVCLTACNYGPPGLSKILRLPGGSLRVIDNDSLYALWQKAGMTCVEKPDFKQSMLLTNVYGGDCLMQLMPHAYFDHVTNTLVLDVYNIWGGCRAGGREYLAVVVDKPKTDIEIAFHEIQVEYWSEYEQHIKPGNSHNGNR